MLQPIEGSREGMESKEDEVDGAKKATIEDQRYFLEIIKGDQRYP